MEILGKLLAVVGIIMVILGFTALDTDKFFWWVVLFTIAGFVVLFIGLIILRII